MASARAGSRGTVAVSARFNGLGSGALALEVVLFPGLCADREIAVDGGIILLRWEVERQARSLQRAGGQVDGKGEN